MRAQIDELFASEGDLGQVLEEVARLATRLPLQAALEAEVTEFLGRDRYERRTAAADPMEGPAHHQDDVRSGHPQPPEAPGVPRDPSEPPVVTQLASH